MVNLFRGSCQVHHYFLSPGYNTYPHRPTISRHHENVFAVLCVAKKQMSCGAFDTFTIFMNQSKCLVVGSVVPLFDHGLFLTILTRKRDCERGNAPRRCSATLRQNDTNIPIVM